MIRRSDRETSIAALIVVALGYALLSVASRLLSIGFQPFTQVYLRLLGAFVISLVIFSKDIQVKKIFSTPKRDWIPLIVMGVLGYGAMVYFVTQGALHTTLLNVSVIMATVPFFSFILSIIFLKAHVSFRTMGLAVISLIGVSIIANNGLSFGIKIVGRGDVFVLISAILLATYSVSRKLLSKHLNNQEITVIVILFAFITTFVMALISGEDLPLQSFLLMPVIAGLLLGASLNIVCTFLESFSFQHLEAVVGNQILLLENLFSPLLGYVLYRESLSPYQVVGALIIIGSVFVNNRNSK